MDKKRILIIDDEQDLIDVLRGRLEEMGYDVEGQTTPVKGQWSTTKRRPNLIILDIKMPGFIDGIDFVDGLTHHPMLTGVPILIYTSQPNPDLRARAIAAGAVDLFVKGVEEHGLIEKIKLLLPQ